MNVELHIDELVLRGFAPADCLHIGDSVKSELARLLAEDGLDASADVRVASISAPVIRPADSAPSAVLGRQIAGSVLEALPIATVPRGRDIGRTG